MDLRYDSGRNLFSSGYLAHAVVGIHSGVTHLEAFRGVMHASPLLLLVSASFHWPYSPATSLHAGFVPPLADPLRAAM